MARVVQRRTSPPYLLIALAFIAVAAIASTIVLALKWDDPAKTAQAEQKKWEPVATPADIDRAKKIHDDTGLTLVASLENQNHELTKVITGIPNTPYNQVLADAEKAKKEIAEASRGTGFTDLLRQVQQEKLAAQNVNSQAKADLDKALRDYQAAVDAQKAQQDAYKAQQDKVAAQIAAAADDAKKVQDNYDAQIKSIKDENKTAMDALNKEVEKSAKQVAEAEKKAKDWELKYKSALAQLIDSKRVPYDPEKPLVQHKGRIVEVVDQIAYIDRGSGDHVVPGMTFGIFAPGTLAPDAKPKATLVVVNVSKNTSECKIKESKTTNPVLSGDQIQNVVYDPQRVYTYVVMGEFDLHQAGKPTRQAQDEVKDMIRRSGGKLSDELTIRTDYLVLGEEPTRPPTLAADASPQDQELNAAQMKAYQEYEQAQKKAGELGVTVLNSNRFLNLMGYTPTKEK